MSAETDTPGDGPAAPHGLPTARDDCWQEVTAPDGLTAAGCERTGWYVLGPLHQVVAHYTEPELGALQALDRYRRERAESEANTRSD